MKKYVISGIILVIGLSLIGWKLYGKSSDEINAENLEITQEIIDKSTSTSVVNIKPTEKDLAWAVLQKYIAFAKNNDLAGVKSLSYQLSTDCASLTEACKAKMQSVYAMGNEFKKAEFSHIWSDSKQIILFTEFIRLDTDQSAGWIHGIIFFTKDTNGVIKLLSFNPARGSFRSKSDFSDAKIQAKLESDVVDNDKDGLEDSVETCANPNVTCNKTDPTKRDTNSNGYWDGVEALFYK